MRIGFAARRRTERAPNAERRLAARNGVRVRRTAVDRVRNETDGTVAHPDVDAAGVVALRGENAPSHILDVRPSVNADRRVRRKNRRKRGVDRATVRPKETAPSVGAGVKLGRVVGSARLGEAGGRFRATVVHRAGFVNAALNFRRFVRVAEHFANRDGVAETVGDERHRTPTERREETATVFLRGGAFVPVRTVVVPHTVADADANAVATHVLVRGRLRGAAVARAKERRNKRGVRFRAMERPRAGGDFFSVGRNRVVARRLLHIRKEGDVRAAVTAVRRAAELVDAKIVEVEARRREHIVGVVIVVNCEQVLLHIVGALHPTSRLARRLDGGEEQADQNADDRDDDQQFDQCKTAFLRHCVLLKIICNG